MSDSIARIRCEDVGMVELDLADLSEAITRWRRGDKREALHHLENALDGHMPELGELRPEELR
ncbi:MAG: hypothetical protein EOP24_34315 [Hyphomicrobiales bacterium]|nr:MAG: hypothetical protein EOP24_34315 [Hyphomicrobiales bacterium]